MPRSIRESLESATQRIGISRFAARVGLVILRQKFVRRRHALPYKQRGGVTRYHAPPRCPATAAGRSLRPPQIVLGEATGERIRHE
jgi:hypothetical protein